MTTYPGQRSHRGAVATALAVIVALGAGVAIGWAVFHSDSPATKAVATPCPGDEQSQLERARAAACLLDDYLTLINESGAVRDAQLKQIMLPSKQPGWSYPSLGTAPVNGPGQPTRYSKITVEYADVIAVKIDRSSNAALQFPAPQIAYRAWVAIVDAYQASSPPLANWYLGDFAAQWENGRWWLSGAFHADAHATPMTYTAGSEDTAFGPGWVGV